MASFSYRVATRRNHLRLLTQRSMMLRRRYPVRSNRFFRPFVCTSSMSGLAPPRAETSRLVLTLPPQEVEEVDALVLAGLVDAQDDQIIVEGGFGEPPVRELPVFGKALDGVLGVVVVPRDAVVIEKGEQLT